MESWILGVQIFLNSDFRCFWYKKWPFRKLLAFAKPMKSPEIAFLDELQASVCPESTPPGPAISGNFDGKSTKLFWDQYKTCSSMSNKHARGCSQLFLCWILRIWYFYGYSMRQLGPKVEGNGACLPEIGSRNTCKIENFVLELRTSKAEFWREIPFSNTSNTHFYNATRTQPPHLSWNASNS